MGLSQPRNLYKLDPQITTSCFSRDRGSLSTGSETRILLQLYRILWIYIAVYDLAKPNLGRSSKAAWPRAWRQAAITIANTLTPLLVAGGEMDIEQVEAGKCSLCNALHNADELCSLVNN